MTLGESGPAPPDQESEALVAFLRGERNAHPVDLLRAGRAADERVVVRLEEIAGVLTAAAGASPIAVMAKAGHANMRTTQTYLHLAGVVFRDEAERLEARLLSAGVSTETSTRLSESEPTLHESASLNGAEAVPAD